MSDKQLALLDQSSDRKYFTVIPNVVWKKGLSLAAFKLYATIKKIAGESGLCFMGCKRLAEEAGLSVGAVSASKQALKDAGLITIVHRKRTARGQAVDHITVVDIWEENILHFAKGSLNEHKGSLNEHKGSLNEHKGSLNEHKGSLNEHKGSLSETEEEPYNKNQEEEKEEKKDFFSDFLKMPEPQSPREQLQRGLAWLLEAEVPDDPHRYKPWEKAVDSIAAGVRKALDKRLFYEECAMLVHKAIERLAGKRNEYPLKNATSPTIPVIELVLREVRAPQGDTRAQQGVVMRPIPGWTAADPNDPEIKAWKEKRDAKR